MRSMTGFGQGRAQYRIADDGEEQTGASASVRIELRSVNAKGLDLKLRVARELQHLEGYASSRLRTLFDRGRIDAQITLERSIVRSRAHLDMNALQGVLSQLRAVDPTITLRDVLHAAPLFVAKDDNENDISEEMLARQQKAIDDAVDSAAADLRASRRSEGDKLATTLQGHVQICRRLVDEVRRLAAPLPLQRLHKMQERIANMHILHLDEDRLLQELALLADRMDVSEEMARLHIHFTRFEEMMHAEQSVGRKLDFLCQEIMREANTTGNKADNSEISHRIVELKAEIERIREQVQNVE